jgi:hypothetical protein
MTDEATEEAYTSKAEAIPETYFIDREGVVRDFVCGSISRKTLESKLKRLL